ncbi:MAG: DUF58 domain-containing protein [Phycisphaerae bacterium]|nr:DUF58 domain-containing protein [Phycisphaerae bacterium]
MLSPDLIKKIKRIEIRTSHLVSDVLAGQFKSAFRGRGMEFEEVRPYQIGDDVRSIDWNVSARIGDPHVKLFREERELTVLLAVDLSGSLSFGTNAQMKRELAAEVAATLAFSAIRSNDKAALLCFTDRIEAFVPPRKGPRHVLRIVREILSRKPEGRGTDLAGALDEVSRTLRRRAVVFVLSDFLTDPSAVRPWEHSMRLARARHDVIPITIGDRREYELPDVGLVEFEDLETGRRQLLDTRSAKVRRQYAEVARERLARRTDTLKRMRMESIDLETGRDFVEPLAAYFRRREARRSH